MGNNNEMTAEKLISVIENDGFENALALMLLIYGKRIERFIRRYLWNHDCIDPECHKLDVTQETFIAVSNAFKKYSNDSYPTEFSNPRSWVYKISLHKAIDHMKGHHCSNFPYGSSIPLENVDYLPSDNGFCVDQLCSKQDRILIIQAKRSLPKELQEAIEDKADGLSAREIAEKRGISECNARQLRFRALIQLDLKLRELGINIFRGKKNK